MSLGDNPIETIPVTRALKRSRGRWRVLAFLALALAVFFALARFTPGLFGIPDAGIARVSITGTITTDRERSAVLAQLARDDRVTAVIVDINSPGGTTAGGEELYASLRALAEHKPVVSTIGELGASAAYMAAIAADQIYARNLSIVGSIGVYYQHVDAGRLFDTIGVDLDKVASGPLKSEPDFDEPITPQVRESLENLVGSSFDYFLDLVIERRALSRARVLELADGRILSGIDALEAGLIDATGGQTEALAWLESEHDIDPDASIREFWPRDDGGSWIDFFIGQGAAALMGQWTDRGLPLDGLVSLWHPSGQ